MGRNDYWVIVYEMEEFGFRSPDNGTTWNTKMLLVAAMCTLEGFCDVSSLAYGAIVYLRIQTPMDIAVLSVTAKTRVAPLHNKTIPRLELLAALQSYLKCRYRV